MSDDAKMFLVCTCASPGCATINVQLRGFLSSNVNTDALRHVTESSKKYTKKSSNVAGVALCLSELGIGIVGVEGLGNGRVPPTFCRVRYSPKAIMRMPGKSAGNDAAILGHIQLTTISLL
jgi:hypothetical protein